MTKSTCLICCKPERLQIDRKIVQGYNYASLAKEHNVSYNSMYNHATNHVSRQLVQAARQRDLMQSMDIIGDVERLIGRTEKILDEVETKKQFGTALSAVRELRGSYELLTKIAFSLHEARLAELQHAQLSQEADQELANRAAMKRLKVLNDDELKLYQRLTDKLDRQDKNLTVEVPRPITFKRTKPPKRAAVPTTDEPVDEPAMTVDDLLQKRQVKILRRSG